SSAIADPFPRSAVQIGDRPDELSPIGMFEVEKGLEIPVQVIRQIGELVPERLLGIAHHRSAEGTSSMAARRGRAMAGAASGSMPWSGCTAPPSSAGGGASTGARVDVAARSASTKAAMSASLPKLMMPYTSCR